MSGLRRRFITIALVLAPVGLADAAELFSGYLRAGNDGRLVCHAVNVSQQPREVTVELFSSSTNPAVSDTAIVQPGEVMGVFRFGSASLRCRVEVQGVKNTVRAVLTVEVGGHDIAAIPLD